MSGRVLAAHDCGRTLEACCLGIVGSMLVCAALLAAWLRIRSAVVQGGQQRHRDFKMCITREDRQRSGGASRVRGRRTRYEALVSTILSAKCRLVL